MNDLIINPLLPSDWTAVAAIYAEGIAAGNATFETAVPIWNDWDAAHRADCRLAARERGAMVGWAALSPVSGRCVYDGVAEVSVYAATAVHGRGVGGALLKELVKSSEEAGVWTLQAGIFPENKASVAIHKRHGFRIVGERERLGRQNGVWRNVLLMERRSAITGR